MKNIYYLILAMAAGICCTSCNNEWEDEQFLQMPSIKAEPNSAGVTPVYVRYDIGGTKRYDLPVLLSGSTMNTHDRVVHFAVDVDTLKSLNRERYGERREIFYQQLTPEYYNFPETVEIPAGECQSLLPINFTMGGEGGNNPLDLSDKWILPLTIIDDPSYDYQANPRKHYRKALLNVTPFNDYSGIYGGTKYMIYMDKDKTEPLTLNEHRAYVHDDKTIFIYAGLRDADFLDRKLYKVFIEFTDEKIDIQKKKLKIYSDNEENNKFKSIGEPYYTIEEEMDPQKPYLKHIYITLGLSYEFEDYNTISDQKRIKYLVEGTLSMQRDLNTLIPDEDQQIQW
ncbi:DUF4973 domain-containing protein [Bacteroides sp.]|uniref:DUF4973 domain-containing protein n=1 Tax=Bacteroides sp. TaxID=29523 RepID=UPI002626B0D9|nr:DUF4973 domain-containing protein [Bacteroides sp.]MDD3036262.1 DUF4973 domain-containing protein [Bacteroides sp.]